MFVVWSDTAESESAARDVQLWAESIADRIDTRLTDEHRREDARVRLRPEGVVFASRDAATDNTSFPVGKFRRTRDTTIMTERRRSDLHD